LTVYSGEVVLWFGIVKLLVTNGDVAWLADRYVNLCDLPFNVPVYYYVMGGLLIYGTCEVTLLWSTLC